MAGIQSALHPNPSWSWPSWARLRKYLLIALVVSPVAAAGIASVVGYRYYTRIAGELNSPGQALSAVANYGGAQIYDRNGVLLYRYPNATGGIQLPVRLRDVSPEMIAATISTEDESYWTNPGIDASSMLHAALDNFRELGGPLKGRGGSGITQQLVKLTLIPANERYNQSLERKLREAIYAIEINRRYSKSQVLEWYLNVVNYGGLYDGVESAAQGYFGVHAKDLDLAQAAMLAGIPQSPWQNSPYLHPENAAWRQSAVLDLMVAHHATSAADADAARRPLTVQQTSESLPLRAPWFVDYVRQELIARFGERCVNTCGLTVSTTLDLDLQSNASAILEKQIAANGDAVGAHNGALVSIDAHTGEILVMVGSRRYDDTSASIQGNNNFATAVLQPGSSFKPFVYLSLFMKRGYGPDSVIWDAPFVTADGYRCENPGSVGGTLGPIPVRLALGSSLNCAANRAASTAGVRNVVDTARAMGFTTLGDPGQYGPSIATGGANVTLLDLAYAYTTLARNGNMIGTPSTRNGDGMRQLDPAAILDVRNAVGDDLFHYEPTDAQVVPASDAYLVTNIISDCQNRRLIWSCDFPGFKLADGRPVAVKTGTQQAPALERTSANWQFMYTPDLVTGGWVGNADRTTWTDRNGGANAVGYSVRDLTDAILKAYAIPSSAFVRPGDVISVPVQVLDRSRGTITGCGVTQQGLFARGTQPDINNRICVNGRVQVPPEQLGTGGLGPYVPDELVFTPTAQFLTPVARATIEGNVPIVARPLSSSLLSPTTLTYTIEWGAGLVPTSWTRLNTETQVGGNLMLGNWNVSALPAGDYTLRVLASDNTVAAIVSVQVQRSTATPTRSPAPVAASR